MNYSIAFMGREGFLDCAAQIHLLTNEGIEGQIYLSINLTKAS